jgi:hypothetical protein
MDQIEWRREYAANSQLSASQACCFQLPESEGQRTLRIYSDAGHLAPDL